MERRNAYRLMDAAQVVENVSHGTQILPTNERQARPLASLPPEQQVQVWQQVVETAPNGKATAASMRPIGLILPSAELQFARHPGTTMFLLY
jgi:hypothetical protein